MAWAVENSLAAHATEVRQRITRQVARVRAEVIARLTGEINRWDAESAKLRDWEAAGRKIRLDYRDEAGQASERVIWPVTIGYRDATRMLVAWCELRAAFRSFRTDRVAGAEFLEDRYPERPAVLRAKWRRAVEADRERWRLSRAQAEADHPRA